MARYADLPIQEDGKLAANVVHFGRALRKAGLPVGPGRIIDAIRAVEAAGFSSREDFFWTLHACFVNRADQRELFAQTFRLFWRATTPLLLNALLYGPSTGLGARK